MSLLRGRILDIIVASAVGVTGAVAVHSFQFKTVDGDEQGPGKLHFIRQAQTVMAQGLQKIDLIQKNPDYVEPVESEKQKVESAYDEYAKKALAIADGASPEELEANKKGGVQVSTPPKVNPYRTAVDPGRGFANPGAEEQVRQMMISDDLKRQILKKYHSDEEPSQRNPANQ